MPFNTLNDLLSLRKKGLEKIVCSHTTRVRGQIQSDHFNILNERIYSTGWRAKYSLKDGISRTYRWVESQVKYREARMQAEIILNS
jgi:nucleoside-diphosphate-sugar epimerase